MPDKIKTKALVTGCAGFIGSHVTDLLLESGFEVMGLDNMSTGREENIAHLAKEEKFQFVPGDIRDASLFNIIAGVDVVFHLAALARIQPSIEDPLTSNMVNHVGTLNVLQYCRKHKAKLIFSSSSSIYSSEELPTIETSKLKPLNPYALQKLQAEQYIGLFGSLYDLNYTILRYFNVYGERQLSFGPYSNVIGIFLDQKENGHPLTITGDGEQRRDFTYVGDVAAANLLAIDWPSSAYNIGAGHNYSIKEIADFISKDQKHIDARPGEVRETLADNSQAKSHGWEPTTSVEEWVRDQVQS